MLTQEQVTRGSNFQTAKQRRILHDFNSKRPATKEQIIRCAEVVNTKHHNGFNLSKFWEKVKGL